MLQEYDMIPYDMRAYLRNYGRHFNHKLCDFAVSMMMGRNRKRIEPITKENVDKMLKDYGVILEHCKGYDYVYVANMAKADFLGSSIRDERSLSIYVKDVVDDPDGCEAMVFNRWLADMDSKGIGIEWEDML